MIARIFAAAFLYGQYCHTQDKLHLYYHAAPFSLVSGHVHWEEN